MKSLVVTGMSLVGPMGASTDAMLSALDEGRSGLRPASEIDDLHFRLPFSTWVGVVPGPLPPLLPEDRAYDTRLARLGMLAIREIRQAIERAIGRWGAKRIAILIGTSTGGLDATEAAYANWCEYGFLPEHFDLSKQHDFNAFGQYLRAHLGLKGPAYVISTACSSSGKVHASAARLIELGIVDAALVGGVDALCRMTLYGFRSLGILDEGRCRPFALERSGINIGEGAGFMLIERECEETTKDALGYFLGAGESADAYNMSSPEPSGRGAKEAMRRAMEMAGIDPSQVGLLIAHGTATPQNDVVEAMAIEEVLGREVPVISTKAYTGHLLGAAGIASAVFALHLARRRKAPPSLGSSPIDSAIRIRVLEDFAHIAGPVVLANAFAFGGSNVCLAFSSEAIRPCN
ncbi:MAG: beta-ketoacyl-[acyl-carrier-protein] synthase II [Sandaracinaceae bacterium]|nr:beta-ketoacyl-[acyl-carrier-protein] synthase II [Sandaracinaceae bacterium]MDW8245920.1 beta-ketoacyl synthase N-terminal-like domain-containing protein [Sandaracinaceae bacterium]